MSNNPNAGMVLPRDLMEAAANALTAIGQLDEASQIAHILETEVEYEPVGYVNPVHLKRMVDGQMGSISILRDSSPDERHILPVFVHAEATQHERALIRHIDNLNAKLDEALATNLRLTQELADERTRADAVLDETSAAVRRIGDMTATVQQALEPAPGVKQAGNRLAATLEGMKKATESADRFNSALRTLPDNLD